MSDPKVLHQFNQRLRIAKYGEREQPVLEELDNDGIIWWEVDPVEGVVADELARLTRRLALADKLAEAAREIAKNHIHSALYCGPDMPHLTGCKHLDDLSVALRAFEESRP